MHWCMVSTWILASVRDLDLELLTSWKWRETLLIISLVEVDEHEGEWDSSEIPTRDEAFAKSGGGSLSSTGSSSCIKLT